MRLTYRCFGSVAFLEEVAVPKRGEIAVACDLPDGSTLVLYSDDHKTKREFVFTGGEAKVPETVFVGRSDVRFLIGGQSVIATPIQVTTIGEENYLIAGEVGLEEKFSRMLQAIGYVGAVLGDLVQKAEMIDGIKEEVALLKKRANSGDILDF